VYLHQAKEQDLKERRKTSIPRIRSNAVNPASQPMPQASKSEVQNPQRSSASNKFRNSKHIIEE
jgi:hypothetical protein